MAGRRPVDRSKLTPLAVEVTRCRDAILRVLAGLRDDRKALMVLTYVTASFVDHLEQSTTHTPEAILAALQDKVLETLDEGVMLGDVGEV
jgi:hypothetical protein